MYDILVKFKPIEDRSKVVSVNKLNSSVQNKVGSSSSDSNNSLKWNQSVSGLGLVFEKGGELVMLK
jgi:hypothetical protein